MGRADKAHDEFFNVTRLTWWLCLLLLASGCAVPTTGLVASPPPHASAEPVVTASAPATVLVTSSLVLRGHTDPVGQLAWSPDGQLLASSAGKFDIHPLTDLSN